MCSIVMILLNFSINMVMIVYGGGIYVLFCCFVFCVVSVWLMVYFVLVLSWCYKFWYCVGVSMVFLGFIFGYVEDVKGLELMDLLWELLCEEKLELVIRVMRMFLMLFWFEFGFSWMVVIIESILRVFCFVDFVMVWMLCFLF